jgi:hypothetical protein
VQQCRQRPRLETLANDHLAVRQRQAQQRDTVLGLPLFLRVLQNQHFGAMGGRLCQRTQAGHLRPQAARASHAAEG